MGGIGDFFKDNAGSIGTLAGTFLGGPAGGAIGGALGGAIQGGGSGGQAEFGQAADWALEGDSMFSGGGGAGAGAGSPTAGVGGNSLLPGSPSIGLGNIGTGGIMEELAKMGVGIMGSKEQEEAYGEAAERARKSADPYSEYRGASAERLNELMTDPSSVTETPGYQYRLDQGLEGVNRGLGAQGQLRSGRRLAGLMDFSQSFAGDEYQRQFEREGALSGAINADFGSASRSAIQGGDWAGQGVGQRYETLGQGLGNIFGWS